MRTITRTIIPALILGLIGVSSSCAIQDSDDEKIEFVNQDGEKIELKFRQLKEGKSDDDVQVSNGKVVIIDSDGNKREIDVDGAQSIVVNKSVQSVITDGDEERKVFGKAIIIGPDGERQEIELGDGEMPIIGRLGNEKFGILDRLPGNIVFGQAANVGKYMIGVNCKPVSEELRAHLDLADGVGLALVGEPVADSPAGKAGIKKHDILVYADQEELTSIEDLVDAIQLAGKEDRKLSLTLLRRGKEVGVELKPAERKRMAFSTTLPKFKVDIEEVGPGILFDKDENFLPEHFLKRMEELDREMQERMKEFSQMRERLEKEFSDLEEDDD